MLNLISGYDNTIIHCYMYTRSAHLSKLCCHCYHDFINSSYDKNQFVLL